MTRFENILYFVDRESPATGPVRLAVARARALGARLTFASVIPPNNSTFLRDRLTTERLEQLYIEDETDRLEQLVDPYRDADVHISTRVLVGDDPVATIVRTVIVDDYHMVWKGPSESRELRDRILGGIDMRLIRACPCPVVIAGSHRPEEDQKVTVAVVDVTSPPEDEEVNADLNDRILDLSLASLTRPDTRLHIVHVWRLYGESIMRSPRVHVKPEEVDALLEVEYAGRREKLEKLVENYRARLIGSEAERFAPEIHLIKGEPSSAIPSTLEQLGADLLVMGTISRGGLTGFVIGNTAEKILHRLECGVAVTKPEGFVSPVPVV
jgi:nucleotide-binding universal stress UspA family protein